MEIGQWKSGRSLFLNTRQLPGTKFKADSARTYVDDAGVPVARRNSWIRSSKFSPDICSRSRSGARSAGRGSAASAVKELHVTRPRIDDVVPLSRLQQQTIDWRRDFWDCGLLQALAAEAARLGHN